MKRTNETTSAGNVGAVSVPIGNIKKRNMHNSDGTIKNALDTDISPISGKYNKKDSKMKKKTNENLADMAHMAEQDHEVQMARADLYKIAKYAIKLHDMLKGVSEQQGLQGWQQAKITKASDYISSVYHNLEYDLKFNGQDTLGEEKKTKPAKTDHKAKMHDKLSKKVDEAVNEKWKDDNDLEEKITKNMSAGDIISDFQKSPEFKGKSKEERKRMALGAYYAENPEKSKKKSKKKVKENKEMLMTEEQFDEAAGEKDACYHKVKSRYKVWPSAYACVPEDSSKALTKDGWKSYNELKIGEEIMTYNIEKDELEFKPIINLYHYSNANTVVFSRGNTAFRVESTQNHKWVTKLPKTKSNKKGKYERIANDMALLETQELLQNKNNKHIVSSATYNGGNTILKNKIYKYTDNWTKYVINASKEQREAWLYSAIVYDGNQPKTQRLTKNKNNISESEWTYDGNHGKQSFGFKQKEIDHRDAFLLSAFMNGGSVSWKKHKNIYSCYYVSNKPLQSLSNIKCIEKNVKDVWCPETENSTWVMMQENNGSGIITITGNSGALVQCRKVGASNWGKKSKK